MSRIFRLHTNGADTIADWQETSAVIESHIVTIPDPAGAKVSNEITSIPTPFARIDLAKTAFRTLVNNSMQADGNTIYHKLVSDCLDVAEILFNIPQLSNQVEIITWDPGIAYSGNELTIRDSSDLGELLQGHPAHRLFGETLKMFLSQDAEAYNFRRLQNIHLINYIGGDKPINIIGGTSPATLFFSSANNLDFVDIKFGSRRVFSAPYAPLHARNEEFIVYLFALKKSIPDFSATFREMESYLMDLTYPKLPRALKDQINALGEESFQQQYASIPIAGAGHHPEILGFEIRGLQTDMAMPGKVSDFVIAPTKHHEGHLPLALPIFTITQSLKYVTGLWTKDIKVPFIDHRPLAQRTLPGQEQYRYPYLTVSDFLEPYLLRLPFAVDDKKFFNGHAFAENGYLLPLKKELFKYFRVTDIQGVLPGTAIKMFELLPQALDAVQAVLRIPVRSGRTIEFKRTYYVPVSGATATTADEAQNKGVLLNQHTFTLAVYPFLKTGSDEHANYRVLMVDADSAPETRHITYRLDFYKDDANVSHVTDLAHPKKSDKSEEYFTTEVYVLDREFDLIQVRNNSAQGLLLPILSTVSEGTAQFTFAVDLGTTNTHIEYSVNGGPSQAFTMLGRDSQVGLFHRNDAESQERQRLQGASKQALLSVHNTDLLPTEIGDPNFSFPRRTVIGEVAKLTSETVPTSLATHNILFTYERGIVSYLNEITDLKWVNMGAGGNGVNRIRAYVEELCMLLRNKVLLNNGRLQNIQIVWFFPTSMTAYRINGFERIWHDAAHRILSPTVELIKISESLAPFYHYRHSGEIIVGTSNAVNIDIGGGTTDMVLFKGNDATSSSSFRFAGNAIFGEGYGGNPNTNGFIKSFKKAKLDSLFKTNSLPTGASQFLDVFQKLMEREKSDDVTNFLFGFRRYSEYKELNLSFTEYLQQHASLKVIPLLAFSAIIYYSAQWIKNLGQDPPRSISFSGNGARFLTILDESMDLKALTKLTKTIFVSVYGSEIDSLQLKLVSNPKEITAKGGLYLSRQEQQLEVSKSSWSGVNQNDATPYTYADLQNPQLKQEAASQAQHFFELFGSWHSKVNFKEHFGINMAPYFQCVPALRQDILVCLEEGIERKLKEVRGEEHLAINETLFFFPLIGILSQLAEHIVTDHA